MRLRPLVASLALLGFICLSCACAPRQAKTVAIPGVPSAVAAAAGAAIPIAVGEKGRCSAVRVSERLILTAAHCAFGFSGGERRALALMGDGDVRYPLRIVEGGAFVPKEGLLHDWVLLTPDKGIDLLSEVGIAELPSAAELKRIEDTLKRPNLRNGPSVWTITFPQASVRLFPRPAPLGDGTFLSRGRLMNDRGYKRCAVLLAKTHQLVDERFGKKTAPRSGDIGAEWEALKQNRSGLVGNMMKFFESYEGSGDPIWYHTADYSASSSGGGVFLERSGALLGIIPMSTAPFDPRATYDGLGHLYRIDRICQESKRMAELTACQQLVR